MALRRDGQTSPVIRDFEPADQDVVQALVEAGMQERWGDRYEPGTNPDLDDIEGRYVAQGAAVVVAEIERAVVGTGTLVSEPDGAGRIVRMSVDSQHRCRGIARALVAELVGRARRRGVRVLRVSTDVPWTDAISLYESCGFVETDRDDDEVHLEMRLD